MVLSAQPRRPLRLGGEVNRRDAENAEVGAEIRRNDVYDVCS